MYRPRLQRADIGDSSGWYWYLPLGQLGTDSPGGRRRRGTSVNVPAEVSSAPGTERRAGTCHKASERMALVWTVSPVWVTLQRVRRRLRTSDCLHIDASCSGGLRTAGNACVVERFRSQRSIHRYVETPQKIRRPACLLTHGNTQTSRLRPTPLLTQIPYHRSSIGTDSTAAAAAAAASPGVVPSISGTSARRRHSASVTLRSHRGQKARAARSWEAQLMTVNKGTSPYSCGRGRILSTVIVVDDAFVPSRPGGAN